MWAVRPSLRRSTTDRPPDYLSDRPLYSLNIIYHMKHTNICNTDYVRLTGLKTFALNNRAGTVISYDHTSQRYGVLLHGDSAPKAVKASNLVSYSYDGNDLCIGCHQKFNLHAFPACACRPSKDIDYCEDSKNQSSLSGPCLAQQ